MNGDSVKDYLKKLGYPLSEEGGTKIATVKQPTFDWLKTPKFYTPEEAKDFGVEIEEGWQLKLSPADNDMGFLPSLINPQGWEVLQDQTWLSPEGDKYSPEEFEAMLSQSYYPSEKEYAGLPPMTHERYQTEKKAYEFEQVFGQVFPDKDIDELNKWLGESDANIAEFIFDIKEIGRTPETESLLKAMYKDVDEAYLSEFFLPEEKPEAEIPAFQLSKEEREVIYEKRMGEIYKEIQQEYPELEFDKWGHPIWHQADMDKDWYKDWRKRQTEAFNLWQYGYGLEGEPLTDIKLFEVAGRGLLQLPKQLAASILQAFQGESGASVVNKDWADKFIEDAETDISKFVDEMRETYGVTIPPYMATLPQNLAYSLTSMGSGLGIGVPIAHIPVPGARVAAYTLGTAASGVVAYRMTTYQIVQQYLEFKNEEKITETGRGLTLGEETQLKDEFHSLAVKYGLWEAVPEAISNLAFVGILTAPLTSMLGKNMATQIVSKIVGIYGQELLTETITQKGQSQIEVEAGLREGNISWAEAFKEIAPQTFLLVTIMGGAGQTIISSTNAIKAIKTSLKTEVGETSPLYEGYLEEAEKQYEKVTDELEKGGVAPKLTPEMVEEWRKRGMPVAPVAKEWRYIPTVKYTELATGMTLIDQAGDRWLIKSIDKTGVPARWAYMLENKVTGQEWTRSFTEVERYLKMEGVAVAPELVKPFDVEKVPLAPKEEAYKPTFTLGEQYTFYKAMEVAKEAREVQAYGEGYYVASTKAGAEFWGKDVRPVTANIKKALIVPADSDLFTAALNAGYVGKEPTMARIIEWARSEGYDAIIGKSVHEGLDHINIINRDVITEIPKAEVGMPEAGLQRGMFGGAKEVRPAGKGKVTQISMEEQLKLEQAKRAEGLSGIEKRIAEIDKLLETKGRLPKGKGTKLQLRLERARLEAERDIAGIDSLEVLRSAREEIERELGNRSLPYHGGAGAGAYAGWMSLQLDEMIKVYQEAEARLTGKPVAKEEIVKAIDVTPSLPGTSLSINQIDTTLNLFTQAIISPDAATQRLATIELRKHHLAQRAKDYASRVEALIIEGRGAEEAMNLARQETMSGKLPEVTTDYFSDLTQEMRDVLFAKVHHYWKVVEPNTFEEISTITALTNALAGKSISRKGGTGTTAFPQGGSAWDRLARTFAGHPDLLKALDQETSLQNIIEGIFIESGRQALTLDQKTVDYLKRLETLTDEDRLILGKPLTELKYEEVRRIAEQEYYRRKHELRIALDEGRIDRVEYELESRIAKDKIYPYPAVTTTGAPTGRAFGLARLGEEEYVPAEITERKTAEQIAKETAELKIELAPPPSTVTRFEPPIEKAFEQLPLMNVGEKTRLVRMLKGLAWSPVDIGNFIRANVASVDNSYFGRQALVIGMGHPVNWYHSFIDSWQAMVSQQHAEASWQSIARDPDFELYEHIRQDTGADPMRLPLFATTKGTVQWRTAEEYGYPTKERIIPRFTAKLPHIRISARMFDTGINRLVWLTWKGELLLKRIEAEKIASGEIILPEGKAYSIEKDMAAFQTYLADTTQRASLGPASKLAPLLSATFFAPRSKLGRLFAPRHLISSNARVRADAWRSWMSTISVLGGIVMLGYWLDLWDVEKDPHSAEYMSIRIGNLRIDPWAGYRQYLVLYTRLITGTGISSVTGAEYDVNPVGALQSFVRSSLSPLASILLDLWTGKNFLGEELDIADKEQWIKRITPFLIQDVWEAFGEGWRGAAIAVVPGIFGLGVQTYTGDWVENWTKLGLPKYLENTAYGLYDPKYDTKDFWADTASRFKGVDPAALTEEKGYPEYIRAIAEARQILERLDLLPNVKLTSINADPNLGYTFANYYQMWQDRKKLVTAGDEKALKEFDADDITKNAYLGNFSQRLYALLVEYHYLTDKEQKQFIADHPEIGIDPRDEWLESHPADNARLAVWGKAKLLSMEAYNHMQKMIDELDIPESGLPEFTLPPEGSVENYFAREEAGKEYGWNSPEARLVLAQDDVLRDWLGLQPVTTSIASLELQVKWREQSDLRDAWGDRESPLYIVDDDERQTKYDWQYETKPEFRDDMRRVEGYGYEFPDDQIDNYVEYYNLPGKGYEQERYLLEHPEFYQSMIDLKDKVPFDEGYKVPDARYDEIYHEWEELFEEYENVTGTESERTLAREAILRDNPEFRKARRRLEAYGKFIPEEHVEDYVGYYEVPPKSSDGWYDNHPSESYYEDDWFLMEHPEFYNVMIDPAILGDEAWSPDARDFTVVPSRDVFKKYKRYKDMESVKSRLWYRCHNEELDDWLVTAKGYTRAYGTDRCLFNQ